jgi:hypothetical protein
MIRNFRSVSQYVLSASSTSRPPCPRTRTHPQGLSSSLRPAAGSLLLCSPVPPSCFLCSPVPPSLYSHLQPFLRPCAARTRAPLYSSLTAHGSRVTAMRDAMRGGASTRRYQGPQRRVHVPLSRPSEARPRAAIKALRGASTCRYQGPQRRVHVPQSRPSEARPRAAIKALRGASTCRYQGPQRVRAASPHSLAGGLHR